MPLALLQVAAEEAEKSKVPFFVAGGLFATWAIVLFIVGMRTRTFIILHRQQPARRRANAESRERVAGDELRAHCLPRSTPNVERHAWRVGICDGEQVDVSAPRLAKADERGIAEHVVFGHVRVRARICEVDQALGFVHWQRLEDQRIDERERRHGRAQRQPQ